MSFFVFCADRIGHLVMSVVSRSLTDAVKEVRVKRRMGRIVDDAVDRLVAQMDDYLNAEGISEPRKEVLIVSLCDKLQLLLDDPSRIFVGNMDGDRIFLQCHPNGELPQGIYDEHLEHFYAVLFPQIAHFLAGSKIVLTQWQAEGFREGFKRLSEIADQVSAVNAKVSEVPQAVVETWMRQEKRDSERILRQFAKTQLNTVLMRLDLSPLRAERQLQGSLADHFVVPAIRERNQTPQLFEDEDSLISILIGRTARRILHGGAGVGKSTFCLWLQSRLLRQNPPRLALIIRLRTVTDIEHRSILDLLKDAAGPHLRDEITKEILQIWYEEGNLVTVLDGFDEVPEGRRDAVERWVVQLDSVAKKSAIIVTSRPLQSGHLERLEVPWKQWDLLPFDMPRIVEFMERWHRHLAEGELSPRDRMVDATALARSFLKDPALNPLAVTPLMLGTLLYVHHRDKKLPSGRADLYDRYITAMLGQRDTGLGIEARATKLSERQKRTVLAHVALHFHMQGTNEVSDDTMYNLVSNTLIEFGFDEDPLRLLAALRERSGLLLGPGAWAFMHKTIGEFLVAELTCDGVTRLSDNRRLDRKELWRNRYKDPWIVVLFFWAGKTTLRELEEFIDDLLNDTESEAPLLALSLLDDQGDRLTFEMQRAFALRVIQKDVSGYRSKNSAKRVICTVDTPSVPLHVYEEFSADGMTIRGMAFNTDTHAMAGFFQRGVLKPNDSYVESWKPIITLAILWAMLRNDSEVHFGMLHLLSDIPRNTLAICTFPPASSHPKKSAKPEDLDFSLSAWLDAFPEFRDMLTLLLAGSMQVSERWTDQTGKQLGNLAVIGPLLWKWREEAVQEEWLKASSECKSTNTVPHDLLNLTASRLTGSGPETFGLTENQHSDLVAWCDALIRRRMEL